MSSLYPEPLERLISHLSKMPGIGPKSAQRLAFYVLNITGAEVADLAAAIVDVKKNIRYCSKCFNISAGDPCSICQDSGRDNKVLCIVSSPKDVIALEKTGQFGGRYHVLGGLISPLDGMGPENLRIKELLFRLNNGSEVKELVIAANPTVEGEATILYLSKLIRPLGLKLTRLASGLPVGSDIDYADEVTLTRAFEGRQEV
jgi:recombination protein RecR